MSISTLGWSIFSDGIYGERTVSGIRNELEMKLAACLSTGTSNGFPVAPDRIKNPFFSQIVGAAMSSKAWTVADLGQCHGCLTIPAEGVLTATLEAPEWGEDDAVLFGLLEGLEGLQYKAMKGDRTL